jgi:TRAP-type C4-dicarboxylate transport system substrate-binding protein
MNRKKSLAGFAIIALVFALTVGVARICPAADTYTIKTIHAWNKNSFDVKQFLTFLELLQQDAEKRYPGQLKLQDRGGSETIANTDQVEANRRGLVDMTYTAASYYTSIMPEMDAMSLSKLMPWEERANGLNDYLEKLHNAKANAHYLGRFDTASLFHLFLSKPIKSVSDLKGMRIRVSPTHIPFIKSVGAEPIGMPPSDIYTAMERGVVDGYVQPPYVIRDFGLVEVSKYMVVPGFYKPVSLVLMNLDSWNKLPKHLQDLLTEDMEKAQRLAFKAYGDKYNSEMASFKNEGMIIDELAAPEAAKFSDAAYKSLLEVVMKKAPEETSTIVEFLNKK